MVGHAVPCNGVCLTADGENGLNGDVHDHEALGTEAVGQNLKSVCNEQTRPGERVEDTEDPNEGNLGVAGAGVCLVRVLVDGASNGPANEVDGHTWGNQLMRMYYSERQLTGVCNQEKLPATNLVNQGSSVGGDNQTQYTFATAELLAVSDFVHLLNLSATYSHLLVLTLNTSTGVHKVNVVGEKSATTVLRDNTEGDQDGQPPAVSASLEEIEIARVLFRSRFHSNGLLHLLVLELHGGVVLVSVRMVVSKHAESFLVALFGDEPLVLR